MKVSKNCINLIKKWEGCQLEADRCPAQVWTIGWGTTLYPDGRKVQPNDRISQQQAEELLFYECNQKAQELLKLVTVPLNQNQFDALVSFTYNVGLGAFGNSTLRRKLNESDYEGAANEFKQWTMITVNGQRVVLQGLVNRRKDEENLFRKIDNLDSPNPDPSERRLLMQGMSDAQIGGNDIITLQTRLKELGYYISVLDGIFGSETVATTSPQNCLSLGVDVFLQRNP